MLSAQLAGMMNWYGVLVLVGRYGDGSKWKTRISYVLHLKYFLAIRL